MSALSVVVVWSRAVTQVMPCNSLIRTAQPHLPALPACRANVQPDPSERADHPLSNQANKERQAGGA